MDFEIKENVLVRYNGSDERVVIPENVTVIGDEAFSENLELKEVVFPKGLKEIGFEAFKECPSLENVNFPDSLAVIGDWAFSDCDSLKEIICPKNLEEIGFCAFSYCFNLFSVELNDNLKRIENGAFEYTDLRQIEIPDSTYIDECLFENCESLWFVKLPADIEIIKEKTFYNCRSLQEVNIPDSVHTIERNAFFRCHKLPQEIKDRVLALNPDCFKPAPEDENLSWAKEEYKPDKGFGAASFGDASSDDGIYSYANDEKICSSRCVDADKPISEVLKREERLYEEQRPKKLAFMASAYTKMLPVVLIWIAIDGTILLSMLFSGIFFQNPLMLLILLFFAVHLTPVWYWIHGIRKRKREYRNLSYGISGKNVYKKRAGLLEYMNLASIVGIDYLTNKGKPIGLTLTAENGAAMDMEYLVSPDDFKSTVIRLRERAKSENN